MSNVQNWFMIDELPLEEAAKGVNRKILAYNENLMAVEASFDEGAVGAMHDHPHEQITYIIEGEFEFTIGDEKRIVKAGDSMYKQPNILHGATCLKAGKLLDVFTPHRADFLK